MTTTSELPVDVLAFDVYGTLIDPDGMVAALRGMVGDDAPRFSQLWRQTQLAYAFRRALMREHVDFSVCTAQALDFAAATFRVELSGQDRTHLLHGYQHLPPFPDADPALRRLARSGVRMVAFSDGSATHVDDLLGVAGLRRHVELIVSSDEVRSFKPDPSVFAQLLSRVGASAARTCLVSVYSCDILGAHAVGLQTAWVRRTPDNILDPWGVEPTVTVSDLRDLGGALGLRE